MVKKFHSRSLDLNGKKSFSAIYEFSILSVCVWGGGGVRTENAKFRKILILKHNSALEYLTMTKFHIGRLELIIKKYFSAILKFLILRGGKWGKHRILKNLDF